MPGLTSLLDARLASPLRSLLLAWPGGRIRANAAQVRLTLRAWWPLAWFARRQVGRLAGLLRPGGLVLNHGITAGGLHNDQLGAGMGGGLHRAAHLPGR